MSKEYVVDVYVEGSIRLKVEASSKSAAKRKAESVVRIAVSPEANGRKNVPVAVVQGPSDDEIEGEVY